MLHFPHPKLTKRPRPTGGDAPPRATRSGLRGFVLDLLPHLWIHATLLLGLIIFLSPFVWMLLTSLRTDEELLEPGVLPAIPRFVAQSPYVRPASPLIKPAEVDTGVWDRVSPQLLERGGNAVLKELEGVGELGANRQALLDAAGPSVVNALTPRIPREAWPTAEGKGAIGDEAGSGGGVGQTLVQAFDALDVGAAARAAVDDRLARLEIRGVQLRTIDAHVATVCAAGEVASKWVVESGNASLQPIPQGGGLLRYDFSKSRDPVTLRFGFTFPQDARPEDLHKLFVAIKPDDSWHRVSATLDIDGSGPMAGRWTSQRTTWLAQHRPVSVIFQPPSFDDDTYRNKVWVPLKREGQGAGGEGQAKGVGDSSASSVGDRQSAVLRLTLTPSSTATAIYGKTIRNYERAFYQVPFFRYVLNSIILVALTTIGMLFSSTFVAYAFARLHWPGRSVALVLLLSTMMLPHQVTMIPQFLIWRELGWYNTLNPIWFPAWLGGAFFIFLMTQHMKTIPKELEEAARLDGLNAVQTWWYIIVPLVKPAAAAIAILTVMGAWNEFMGPLIFLRDQSKFPLSLGLFALRVDARNDWTLIMAGNVMMTVPVLVMFFLFQRYFIQGMSMSGMKG